MEAFAVFRLTAVESRLLFVLPLQWLANILVADHDADAFRWIGWPTKNNSGAPIIDVVLQSAFDGLAKWDSLHFLHVAEFGYVFESDLAFYPLFPMLVRLVGRFFALFLQRKTALLSAAVAINWFCFGLNGLLIYRLALRTFESTVAADLSVFFFAANPASIFFTACYSEALYSTLSTYGIYWLYCGGRTSIGVRVEHMVVASALFALAALTRSNGLLNCLFVAAALLRPLMDVFSIRRFFRQLIVGSFCAAVILLPAICHVLLVRRAFCLDREPLFGTEQTAANALVFAGVADRDGLVLAGQVDKLPWCQWRIAAFYGHIQRKYWQVELFGYYQWRKFPLFLLAAPTVLLLCSACVRALAPSVRAVLTANTNIVRRLSVELSTPLIPMALQALTLLASALLFINVEVITRLAWSSSPFLCYYLAHRFQRHCQSRNSYAYSTLKLLWATGSPIEQLILLYCVGYCTIGCCLHANFLPWT